MIDVATPCIRNPIWNRVDMSYPGENPMPDYGATLTFNGDPQRAQFLDETPLLVTLGPATSEARCTTCGQALRKTEDDDGDALWVDQAGVNVCDHGAEHTPESLPFAWMTDASIQLQPCDDGATEWVEVSITLPQGTVRLRVEHVETGHAAGRLLVHMTRPDHHDAPPLLRSGDTYVIG